MCRAKQVVTGACAATAAHDPEEVDACFAARATAGNLWKQCSHLRLWIAGAQGRQGSVIFLRRAV